MKNTFLFVLACLFWTCKTRQATTSTANNGPDNETTINLINPATGTEIRINQPKHLVTNKKLLLLFYALPNGNSIEWTMGKKMQAGDDWHFDIQHIAAQTRYLRTVMTRHQVVTIYLSNRLKSWPAWKKQQSDGPAAIKKMVDSIAAMYADYHPEIALNSHSGGGSWLFGYLDAVKVLPEVITSISFIDSDYGFEDSLHTAKLTQWLQQSKQHRLSVLAYNDSVVIYQGKPLVSPKGGTWYRSKWMQQSLARTFDFRVKEDSNFIHYFDRGNQIDMHLKQNPEGKIYHTEQVARNGLIHTILTNTKYDRKAKYQYWGERVYDAWIY